MNTKHTAFGFDVIIDETLSPSEWELRQVRKQDTKHTDSVEATTKEKAIAITVRLETEIFKGRFSSSTLEEIEQVLLEEITTLQATQSQQVEEAVRKEKERWIEACDRVVGDDMCGEICLALTTNHQD